MLLPRGITRAYAEAMDGTALSAYLPQNYWTDLKRPWDVVMRNGCDRCQPIGPVEPILPANATHEDVRACVAWGEQQGFGSISL